MAYMSQELDLFSEKPIITGIESHDLQEVGLLNSISNSNILEFSCLGHNNKLKSLNNLYIKLMLKITKSDGTDYESAAETDVEAHLVSNAAFSIFSTCQVTLGNVQIASYDGYYAYKSYIESILSHEDNLVSSRYTKSHLNVQDHETKYLNQVSRKSATFELYAKLSILPVDRYLLTQVPLTVKLSINNPAFYMIDTSKAAKPGKLQFISAALYVKHITVSTQLLLAQEKLLNAGKNAVYTYNKAIVVSTNIAKGTTNMNLPAIYSGIRPSMIITGNWKT